MKPGAKQGMWALVIVAGLGFAVLWSVAQEDVNKLRTELDAAESEVVMQCRATASADTAQLLSTGFGILGVPVSAEAVRAIADIVQLRLPTYSASLATVPNDSSFPAVLLVTDSGDPLPLGDVNRLFVVRHTISGVGVIYLTEALQVRFTASWPQPDANRAYPLKLAVLRYAPDRAIDDLIALVRSDRATWQMMLAKVGLSSAFTIASDSPREPRAVYVDLKTRRAYVGPRSVVERQSSREVAPGLFIREPDQSPGVDLEFRDGALHVRAPAESVSDGSGVPSTTGAMSGTDDESASDPSPRSFKYYCQVGDAGWRFWSRVDSATYRETSANGTEITFTVTRRLSVDGTAGTEAQANDRDLVVFIPDRDEADRRLLQRSPATDAWAVLGDMEDVQ